MKYSLAAVWMNADVRRRMSDGESASLGEAVVGFCENEGGSRWARDLSWWSMLLVFFNQSLDSMRLVLDTVCSC